MPLRSAEPTLSPDAISALLEHDDYQACRFDQHCWRGRFRAGGRVFPYVVHIDQERQLITMAVVPFLRTPDDDERAAALYTRLLELNQVLMMANFAIDDDLDVWLSVSHPLTAFQESELRDGLQALFYYAGNHYDELSRC